MRDKREKIVFLRAEFERRFVDEREIREGLYNFLKIIDENRECHLCKFLFFFLNFFLKQSKRRKVLFWKLLSNEKEKRCSNGLKYDSNAI